jgi:hypothetical protein
MPSDAGPAPVHKPDERTIRLFDLAAHEIIVIRCECGRITEYRRGFLQRHYRIPSDTLVYDLQFRLRCGHCNRIDGFAIGIVDTRNRGDNSAPRTERIVVSSGRIAQSYSTAWACTHRALR